MGIGILIGLALSGPAAQAATTITATLSSQPIYVDGQRVPMTAYSIGGNYYVRLRDIGKAVNFGVIYDAASNTVQVNSNQPYREESPQIIPGSLEERVQITLAQLKERYPDGTVYPTPYCSTSSGPYTNGIHCAGWAALCSDAAFGDLPWRRVDRPSWGHLRSGAW